MPPFSGRLWTRFLRLFWTVFFLFSFPFSPFQKCHLRLPSVSSDLFLSLYYLEECQIPYLPFCISGSPHSDCPLIRAVQALWRNVLFSIKNLEKSKPGYTNISWLASAGRRWCSVLCAQVHCTNSTSLLPSCVNSLFSMCTERQTCHLDENMAGSACKCGVGWIYWVGLPTMTSTKKI